MSQTNYESNSMKLTPEQVQQQEQQQIVYYLRQATKGDLRHQAADLIERLLAAPLVAPQATVEPIANRPAFEAWIKAFIMFVYGAPHDMTRTSNEFGESYVDVFTAGAWSAWQHLAGQVALQATPTAALPVKVRHSIRYDDYQTATHQTARLNTDLCTAKDLVSGAALGGPTSKADAGEVPGDTLDRLCIGKATGGDQMLAYNALLATPPASKATEIQGWITLSPAEIQSGCDRVQWAEGLILQLPNSHDGRNSWLLNYGSGKSTKHLPIESASKADTGEATLSAIKDSLEVMLASAVALGDGEWVDGYQIKTGALHRILGIMVAAKHPVSIALPGAPSTIKAATSDSTASLVQQMWDTDANKYIDPKCRTVTHGGDSDASTIKAEPTAFLPRDESRPAEQQGLFNKFDVRRVDGSDALGGKHHGCKYFILDIDHDLAADPALRAYAKAVKATHPLLASDILAEVDLVIGKRTVARLKEERAAKAEPTGEQL